MYYYFFDNLSAASNASFTRKRVFDPIKLFK